MPVKGSTVAVVAPSRSWRCAHQPWCPSLNDALSVALSAKPCTGLALMLITTSRLCGAPVYPLSDGDETACAPGRIGLSDALRCAVGGRRVCGGAGVGILRDEPARTRVGDIG